MSALERLRAVTPTLSVGVISADLMSLGADIARLEKAGVTLLHFDVMDGCFCPMLTVGAPFVKAVRTTMLKDVHLMVDEPLDKLPAFLAAGADIVTVHVESCRHPHRLLQALTGVVRGIALNPGTPVAAIEPLLDDVDVVTLLAINPGWSGQTFLPATASRVAQVRELSRDILIAVDGGVTKQNIAEVAKLKPDIIVTGSAVFEGGAIEANLAALKP